MEALLLEMGKSSMSSLFLPDMPSGQLNYYYGGHNKLL
jgi:hypothetical protein